MTGLLALPLMILFAVLSLAAVVVLVIATMTVGVGGFLPFSGVPESVRLKAAPYRRWFVAILTAALVVCVLLAVIQVLS